jgi:xanthine dehydrogenase YagR molybdenum-binding subunit
LAQVVAEELGLRPSDVTVRIGDTAHPSGTASGGSKTTGSITPAARNAAYRAKLGFLKQIAPKLGVEADALVMSQGRVFDRATKKTSIEFKRAAQSMKTEQIAEHASRSDDYGGFIPGVGGPRTKGGIGGYGGVQFAEISVDVETGVIRVERVVAVHDCGRPLNPLGIENQINGGILQGISYALYENRILDRNTGLMVNPNLESYKVLGAREVPAIDIVILEEYRGRSSTDAGGIGEPATIPTAAAIANAFYDATRVRLRELPMTPSRVIAALERGGRA